jgi:hypothetical protein
MKALLYDKVVWYEPKFEWVIIPVLPDDDPLVKYYKAMKQRVKKHETK